MASGSEVKDDESSCLGVAPCGTGRGTCRLISVVALLALSTLEFVHSSGTFLHSERPSRSLRKVLPDGASACAPMSELLSYARGDGLSVALNASWPPRSYACHIPSPPGEGRRAAAASRRSSLRANVTWFFPAAAEGEPAARDVAHYSVWEVSRLGAAVRDELLARAGPILARPPAEVAVLSPALVAGEGGRFLLVTRVSQTQTAQISGSVLWAQELTHDFALSPRCGGGWQVELPGTMTVPNPGGEDPRMILGAGGEPLVFFNAQWSLKNERGMYLARPRFGTVVKLRVVGHPAVDNTTQKNWVPMWHDGALYVLFSAVPLTVLRCELDGACTCVFSEVGGCTQFGHAVASVLRPGSPLVPVGGSASGLYFTTLHSLSRKNEGFQSITTGYRAHAALLSTRPWGWVAVSSHLTVPPSIAACGAHAISPAQRAVGIAYPTSALLVGPRGEGALVGLHFADAEATLLQFAWDEALVDRVDAIARSACLEGGGGGGSCTTWATMDLTKDLDTIGAATSNDMVPPCKRTVEYSDTTLLGVALASLAIDEQDRCHELCCDDVRCAAFVFVADSHSCMLMSASFVISNGNEGSVAVAIVARVNQDKATVPQQLPPLAPGWTQHVSSSSGRLYYYHAASRESTFVRPV